MIISTTCRWFFITLFLGIIIFYYQDQMVNLMVFNFMLVIWRNLLKILLTLLSSFFNYFFFKYALSVALSTLFTRFFGFDTHKLFVFDETNRQKNLNKFQINVLLQWFLKIYRAHKIGDSPKIWNNEQEKILHMK